MLDLHRVVSICLRTQNTSKNDLLGLKAIIVVVTLPSTNIVTMNIRRQSQILILLTATMVIIFFYKLYQSTETKVTAQIRISDNGHSASSKSDPVESKQAKSDDITLREIVEKVKRRGKPLLVTVINDAYMPFAHSWLCNTIYMGIHEQVLVIATDTKSRDEIASKWPNIFVIALPGQEDFHGDQDYSHAGYVRIMIRRTEILLGIMKHEVEILMFDLDTFWLTNPIPDCQKQVQGHDIAVIPVSDRKNVICGGFLYMKPTSSMIKLWEKLTEMMKNLEKKIKSVNDKKAISEGDNDQVYISDLLAKKYAGIRVKELSLKDYPDGKWYSMKESEREKLHPLVIHNNWIIGNKAKMNRAEKFHQWFWDSDAGKCKTDLVILKTAS